MQPRQYSGQKQGRAGAHKGNAQVDDFVPTMPVYTLKKREGDSLVNVGGAFAKTSKNGVHYFSVSKTPLQIYETERGDLALKARPEGDGKLETVCYLKPATTKNGDPYFKGTTSDGEDYLLFTFEKRA